MLRRLHHEQPAHFAFTPANLEWAKGQIAKYPEGRQASAVIPLLWRAQEQEGWVSRPAIEEIARMLGMAYIRVLEVATFYFMFQLQPVGSVAHVQVCGTTSCMICGAEDLIAVCRRKIAPHAHEVSADGRFSWEEVECLGACANAPMAQIGKDYYEDLTAERLRGDPRRVRPRRGAAAGAAERPLLLRADRGADLADRGRAGERGECLGDAGRAARRHGQADHRRRAGAADGARRRAEAAADRRRARRAIAGPAVAEHRPEGLAAPRGAGADDLKLIKGVGPELEALLHRLGFFHFRQIAAWTPEEVAWVDGNLEGFHGRVTRDGWVEQARQLAEEGDTPHAHEKVERDATE